MISIWNGVMLLIAAFRAMFAADAFCYRRRRRRFLAGREPLSNASFLEGLPSGAPHTTCLAVRDALAGQCGLPPEMLSPGDSLHVLLEFPFGGFDLLDFVMRLEEELGWPLRHAVLQRLAGNLTPLIRSPKTACLADFVCRTTEAVAAASADFDE